MKSFLLKIALSLAVVGVVACSKSDVDDVAPLQPITEDVAQQGEVRIVVPEGTRSVLEDNGTGGANLRWTSGDEIKLVARNENGDNAFDPCVFYFWANKNVAGESYFRTPSLYGDDRETTMPEGSYIYYAVSPSTAIIDGTTAKFTLPAGQNGEFSAEVDFMVATVKGGALVACQGLDENENPKQETDPKNNLPLVFRHKTHILRFTIPANSLGQKVRRLYMVFPTAVAGTMAVNMDDGTIASTENTTNKITVDFAEPKDAGDEFYVMILPQTEKFAKVVDMRFEGVDGTTFSTRHLVNFENRVCSENKLTPVKMSIPAATGVTSFYYTEGTNYLGESLTSINIALPDGCYFTNYEQEYKASVDSNHNATFLIFSDIFDSVKNLDLKLFELESEHALIPMNNKKIGELKTDSPQETITVPYLFFEDFSGIGTFSDGHDNPANGGNSDDYLNATMLDNIEPSLTGWSASRIGGNKDSKSIRIMCRYEGGMTANAYYKGRLDSPAIGKLKSNAKIKVFYKYGGAYTEYFTAGNSLTNKNKSGRPQMYFGWTTDTGALAPDTRFQTTQYQAPSHLPNIVINKTEVSNGATYSSNINIECQTEPFEANASTRLTWYVSSNIEAGWKGGNGNFWLYLDDIKVSIVK